MLLPDFYVTLKLMQNVINIQRLRELRFLILICLPCSFFLDQAMFTNIILKEIFLQKINEK